MKRMNNINIVNQLTGIYGVLITCLVLGLGALQGKWLKARKNFYKSQS